ncbi:MAG: hypothetical protein U0793_08540 [Gemmataceae bacterium]
MAAIAGVVVAAVEALEAGAEVQSIAQMRGHVRQRGEVLHTEGRRRRVAVDGERVGRRTEVSGAEAEDVDVLPAVIHTGDVVGHAVVALGRGRADHGADHGMIVDEAIGLGGVAAGEEAFVAAAVIGEGMGDGADDRVFVGAAGV